MEILVILLFCGIIFLFAHLYDKFIGDPLTSKNIEENYKKENDQYKKLGINPKKESPYKIQKEINHIKEKIGYTNQLISKLNNKEEDIVKKKNLNSQCDSYYKEFEKLRDKGLLLADNNLAEICNNCGTLRSIPKQAGVFGVKKINTWDPILSPCPGCSLEIGYECSKEKEMKIITNIINSYTGPIYNVELPKTHPKSSDYYYSKKNLNDYLSLRKDFDLYLASLPHKKKQVN